MNKKDIIIVAALLNAATLAILFMLAVRVDDDGMIDPFQIEPSSQHPIASPHTQESNGWGLADAKTYSTDEVDDILRDFDALAAADVFPLSQPLEPEKIEPAPLIEAAVDVIHPEEDFHIVEIVVKKGDILERIARANGTTVSDIKKLNQLKTERLAIGQVLRVPVGSAKKEVEPIASKPGEPVYYIIKSGDSPWKISKLMHIKMEELLELNQLDEEKARNLKIGDKIRIR